MEDDRLAGAFVAMNSSPAEGFAPSEDTMEIFDRTLRAGRGAECALDPRVLDLESPSVTIVRRVTVTIWLGRLAYGGMLALLAALGLGVWMAHSGMR